MAYPIGAEVDRRSEPRLDILDVMSPRFSLTETAPELYRAQSDLAKKVKAAGLEKGLVHLIFLRVSQINGCAYCIDMHSKDARNLGESEQRLYALNAWRETPFFTPRERAAFALAEALTTLPSGHPSDELFDEASKHFDEQELATVVWATAAINTWNRVTIAARTEVGGYRPAPA